MEKPTNSTEGDRQGQEEPEINLKRNFDSRGPDGGAPPPEEAVDRVTDNRTEEDRRSRSPAENNGVRLPYGRHIPGLPFLPPPPARRGRRGRTRRRRSRSRSRSGSAAVDAARNRTRAIVLALLRILYGLPPPKQNVVEELQRLRLGGFLPINITQETSDEDVEEFRARAREALRPHYETLREIERSRLAREDYRSFRQGRQYGFDYRNPADFPIPDMPVYGDALHEFFHVPDPEDLIPQSPDRHGVEELQRLHLDDEELESPWPQHSQGNAVQILQIGDDVEDEQLEYSWPQHSEGSAEHMVGIGDYEDIYVYDDELESPWPQHSQGNAVEILQIGDDDEEPLAAENDYGGAPPAPEGAGAVVQDANHVEPVPDAAVQNGDAEPPPERPYVDLDVEPVINNDRPFNTSRDTELLWGPYIAAGVPTFRSFQEREEWITEMSLSEWAHERAVRAEQLRMEMEARAANVPDLTEEEQAIADAEQALLVEEMLYYGSSAESALSDPGYESPPRPSSPTPSMLAWRPDSPGELFPRRTFEPYYRPVRPAEWTPWGRDSERAGGEDLHFLVMIGEIDPDFECFRGNIRIIHPGQLVRGRRFPTGCIRVLHTEEDFQNFRVMHGDLILKIGQFVDAFSEFGARPYASHLWIPLLAASLHSFVDLTTRTNVNPDSYASFPGKFIGWLFNFNADDEHPLSVNDLAPSSTVREQRVGTICTALFRPQLGDLIILPQAWEDNFSHMQNFRRSMLKWYKGAEASGEFITDGTMIIRYCVDREFRSDGYRMMGRFDDPLRLPPLTHPSDPDYNWGFVELFMWDGADWFFWGRDKLRPTPNLPSRTGRCMYYCSNA